MEVRSCSPVPTFFTSKSLVLSILVIQMDVFFFLPHKLLLEGCRNGASYQVCGFFRRWDDISLIQRGSCLITYISPSLLHRITTHPPPPPWRPQAVDKRNKNHQQIMRQMAFPKASADGPLPPMEHDLCLFFGDLNYRIASPASRILIVLCQPTTHRRSPPQSNFYIFAPATPSMPVQEIILTPAQQFGHDLGPFPPQCGGFSPY